MLLVCHPPDTVSTSLFAILDLFFLRNPFIVTAKTLRQTHRVLAPIMLLPIVLTVITGSLYQLVDMAGKDESFEWLLDLHKGNFGILNLESVYPFLNSLGLMILVATGIVMWLQPKRRFQKKLNS
jgi:hypothetical protein